MVDLPNAGRTIVFAAGCNSCLVEGADLLPILRQERNVKRLLRLGMRSEPEFGLAGFAESGPPIPVFRSIAR
jgi:hypothetical protein